MKYIKDRVRAGEVLFGTFINLGSPLTAEILGLAGYDWGLIDLEHGAGDEGNVLAQIQAMEHTLTVPIVRIESGSRPRFHRPLDFGAAGIMVPRVDSVEQAREAIAGLHYPPKGTRGLAQMNRACEFGATFRDYMVAAADKLLGIVQIESPSAVRQAGEIAAIDAVDVLFVGPSDLSHSMGIFGQTEHPFFLNAFDSSRRGGPKSRQSMRHSLAESGGDPAFPLSGIHVSRLRI